jgi:luciferase family oxidoreductase group 1
MDFGIFDEVNAIDGVAPSDVYDAHLEQVGSADRLGYHSYWFAEHHFSDHRLSPSPNLLLAAAANRTDRILLGNMVNVLPFHEPVRLAEECAMLDHLSRGRLQVGIGRGVQPLEFSRQGRDMAASRKMFVESAEMLQHVWTTPGATRTGDHWRYEDVTLMPPVVQQPHPPMWFTGMSEASMRWAAEGGLPFVSSFLSNDELEALGDEYRKSFRPTERNPEPYFAVMRHVYVSDSLESAREEVGHVYERLFSAWLDVALTDSSKVPDSYKSYPAMHRRLGAMTLDDLLAEGLVLFGSPDDVARGVSDLERRNIDMLLLWVSPKEVPPELVDRCIETFATAVMPRFSAGDDRATTLPAAN